METKLTKNPTLLAWLDEKVELLKPSEIVWIDGSTEQQKTMLPVLRLAHLSAQLKKRMQVRQTTGWILKNATKCFMTLLPAHTRAEQCISSLTQWVL